MLALAIISTILLGLLGFVTVLEGSNMDSKEGSIGAIVIAVIFAFVILTI